MLETKVIRNAFSAPEGWTDTPEQAQLRECLINIVSGHEETDTIRITHDLITVMRDQLMSGARNIRMTAAVKARTSMSPGEIADATGQTKATILRLLTEHRNM